MLIGAAMTVLLNFSFCEIYIHLMPKLIDANNANIGILT